MKKIINILFGNKLYLITLIAAHTIYCLTLVTLKTYYIYMVIGSVTLWLLYKLYDKKGATAFVLLKIFLYLYVIGFSGLFFIPADIKAYRLPMKSYSFVNRVQFTFEGTDYTRHCSLGDYSKEQNLKELYDVSLGLRSPVPGVYIIESTGLIEKTTLQ